MKKLIILLCLILFTSCYSKKYQPRHNSVNHNSLEFVKYNTHYYIVRSRQYYYQSNNCFRQQMQGRK
jgi:hypothetical protein